MPDVPPTDESPDDASREPDPLALARDIADSYRGAGTPPLRRRRRRPTSTGGRRNRDDPVPVSDLMGGHPSLIPAIDHDTTTLLVFVGTNPVVSHGHLASLSDPVVRLRHLTSGDREVWVLDPRRTETARLATRHLEVRPGGDYAFFAHAIRDDLSRRWTASYDDTAAIGRLYRRQDEVGTPYCVTVDVQTVGDRGKGEAGDGRVTIRDRDSMEQIRVPVPELVGVLGELMAGSDWSRVASRFGSGAPKA